jgi:hypothetical protein
MLLGVCHLANFWSLASQTMQLQVGLPVVVIHSAFGSMGKQSSEIVSKFGSTFYFS